MFFIYPTGTYGEFVNMLESKPARSIIVTPKHLKRDPAPLEAFRRRYLGLNPMRDSFGLRMYVSFQSKTALNSEFYEPVGSGMLMHNDLVDSLSLTTYQAKLVLAAQTRIEQLSLELPEVAVSLGKYDKNLPNQAELADYHRVAADMRGSSPLEV